MLTMQPTTERSRFWPHYRHETGRGGGENYARIIIKTERFFSLIGNRFSFVIKKWRRWRERCIIPSIIIVPSYGKQWRPPPMCVSLDDSSITLTSGEGWCQRLFSKTFSTEAAVTGQDPPFRLFALCPIYFRLFFSLSFFLTEGGENFSNHFYDVPSLHLFSPAGKDIGFFFPFKREKKHLFLKACWGFKVEFSTFGPPFWLFRLTR